MIPLTDTIVMKNHELLQSANGSRGKWFRMYIEHHRIWGNLLTCTFVKFGFKEMLNMLSFQHMKEQCGTIECETWVTSNIVCFFSICNGYGSLVHVLSFRTLRFDSGESMHTRNSQDGFTFEELLFCTKQLKQKSRQNW